MSAGGSVTAVVKPVVLGEEITSVVVAVGHPHDGVDVEAGGLGIGEEDAGVVVVLDQEYGGMDPVLEGALVVVAAAPGKPRLVEVLAYERQGALGLVRREAVEV